MNGFLSGIGEFGAIDHIKSMCGSPGRGVVGIGDDAAIFKVSPGMAALVTTDMLVEGVHFDLTYTGFEVLGYKSAAVNLSDIAAMGGRPRFYLVSAALRPRMRLEELEGFYRGLESACRPFGVRLIGGDTTSSFGSSCGSPYGSSAGGSTGPLVISVTIIGEAYPGRAVKRTGAKVGDDIYVTGSLGDSACGLAILKARGTEGLNKDETRLAARHLRPSPRIRAGRLLGEARLASAMIDISDGLSSDLGHILEQSGVGAVVYKDRLPISGDLMQTAGIKKAVQFALHGGEDYELLFTARPSCRKKIAALQEKAGVSFTSIGNITAEDGALLVDEKGQGRALRPSGYEHFRK